jgi:PII-like signaling protein
LAQWTHKQYETLERAIASGKRISAYRRGTEFIVVPIRLRIVQSREAIEATHPTTGEMITLYLDEMESVEVVR